MHPTRAPVVIDTGNYYPQQRDDRIDEIEKGTTESRWVERQLGRPVVKAFNNINAQHLLERGQPAGTLGRIALPVAGDDAKAKAVVLQLVETNSGLTVSIPVDWMSLGGSSQGPRCMERTLMRMVCGAPCPKPRGSVGRNGVPNRAARSLPAPAP
jgi:hypothetical protein